MTKAKIYLFGRDRSTIVSKHTTLCWIQYTILTVVFHLYKKCRWKTNSRYSVLDSTQCRMFRHCGSDPCWAQHSFRCYTKQLVSQCWEKRLQHCIARYVTPSNMSHATSNGHSIKTASANLWRQIDNPIGNHSMCSINRSPTLLQEVCYTVQCIKNTLSESLQKVEPDSASCNGCCNKNNTRLVDCEAW
jgi:hypothetical protein